MRKFGWEVQVKYRFLAYSRCILGKSKRIRKLKNIQHEGSICVLTPNLADQDLNFNHKWTFCTAFFIWELFPLIPDRRSNWEKSFEFPPGGSDLSSSLAANCLFAPMLQWPLQHVLPDIAPLLDRFQLYSPLRRSLIPECLKHGSQAFRCHELEKAA